jgi:nitroreductase
MKIGEVVGRRKGDADMRRWWQLQGLRLYGAPAAIYVYTGRSLYFQRDATNVWPVFDCGLIAENIMLLATKYGLGTIPQMQAVHYPDILRRLLQIPDSKLIVLGIAVGYPDWDDPMNQFRSGREPLDRIARWYGFD